MNIKEKKLARNSLPTIRGVIEAINFERNEVSKAEGIIVVAKKILALWQQASIPTLRRQRVTTKITQLYDKYVKLTYVDSRRSNYAEKIELFEVIKLG